ncbi:MAG: ANTAR domain-containing protein, partial [Firmicutes bacterium]|nr:ANTAR domain-containing protein [Bacillota bacterium]
MSRNRVVVAAPDPQSRRSLRERLRQLGYLVVGEAGDGKEALHVTFQTQPDLVVFHAELPSYQGLDVAAVIDEHRVAPLLFVARRAADVVRLARNTLVYAYVVEPFGDEELTTAAEVALANFQKTAALEQENKKLKKELAARKVVERAKGLLMQRRGWSEKESYRYLQKLSMDRSVPLSQVAREVIRSLEEEKIAV